MHDISKPTGCETRTLAVADLRAAEQPDKPKALTGYAALFNSDSDPLPAGSRTFVERILPGAFSKVLNQDTRALVNHDPNMVIGRTKSGTLSLEQDKRGLRVEITPPDTSYARDLMESVRRGDVTQMSFAFRVADGGDTWTESKDQILREIREIGELADVSVVTYPAYPDTSVAARSLDAVIPVVSPADAGTVTETPIADEAQRRQSILEMSI